jgi:hypothetical protein
MFARPTYRRNCSLCSGSNDASSLSTRMNGETVTNGIFFDAVALINVTVVGLDMRLKKRYSKKNIIVTVLTKQGIHDGGDVSVLGLRFSFLL